MLGNQGVTESNMMQYLGIIEQRTSEILQAYAASQQMTQAVETQVLFKYPKPQACELLHHVDARSEQGKGYNTYLVVHKETDKLTSRYMWCNGTSIGTRESFPLPSPK